jgi:asparagine synthase (glutamine-hydrolysing)
MQHLSRVIKDMLRQTRFGLKSPTGFCILRRIRSERLSYLEMPALIDLYEAVSSAESQQTPGVIVEAGTALGGSAIAMAAAKLPGRPMLIFDAFETIPPPSERDGNDAHQRYVLIQSGKATGLRGDTYYGYRVNLLEQVEHNFSCFGYPLSQHNIHLIKGYYVDTLRLNQPVVVAHLDCDWYDSVLICLERIVPYLVVGGRLIIDDYQHWSGCKRAVDDYFAGRKTGFEFVMKSRLHIIRA